MKLTLMMVLVTGRMAILQNLLSLEDLQNLATGPRADESAQSFNRTSGGECLVLVIFVLFHELLA